MRVDALTHIHTHIHIHRTHKSVHGLEADRKAKKEAKSRGGAKPEVRLESWMEKALLRSSPQKRGRVAILVSTFGKILSPAFHSAFS